MGCNLASITALLDGFPDRAGQPRSTANVALKPNRRRESSHTEVQAATQTQTLTEVTSAELIER